MSSMPVCPIVLSAMPGVQSKLATRYMVPDNSSMVVDDVRYLVSETWCLLLDTYLMQGSFIYLD